MRINHNISAINANRQLAANRGTTSKSLEKLSSGLRINSAGDDAAGLAISEKMRTQIRGLAKAQSNAQDSISLIQTAEGALQQVSDILQRMRELAVQSMNGILSDTEKTSIGSEMTQLRQEVDRIAETSKFNNTYLLKGTLGLAVNTSASDVYNTASGTPILADGIKAVDVTACENETTYAITVTPSYEKAEGTTGELKVIDNLPTTQVYLAAVNKAKKNAADTFAVGEFVTLVSGKYEVWTSGEPKLEIQTDHAADEITIDETGIDGITNLDTVNTVNRLSVTYIAKSGKSTTATSKAVPTTYTGFITFTDSDGVDSGLKIKVEKMDITALDGKNIKTGKGGETDLQIGANSEDTPLKIEIQDLRSQELKIDNLSVMTTALAKETLIKIDDALDTLNTARGKLGAYQNRLEYTLNSLAASEENLTAAESRIRDVDMAAEMVNYTKANILNQTATAMLAQANQAPQSVLQLLQGL